MLKGTIISCSWDVGKGIFILLKEDTDFIEPQLLWNHIKLEIFVLWRIGIGVLYCLPKFSLKHLFPQRIRQKLRGRPFDSAGIWQFMSSQNIYFKSFRATILIFIQLQNRHFLFKDIAYLNLMDAGLFIYIPRDPGKNINFQVFDGQNIFFKKPPASPPPPIQLFVPNKKGDQFQPFPNSTDCHT